MFKSLLCFLVFFTPPAVAADPLVPRPPQLSAKSYVLIEHGSGDILAHKQIDSRYDPASLTKLMTAYVAYQALAEGMININDKVIISEKAWRTGGSRSFVEAGKEVPVSVLLAGTVIQSGNDASVALAEHVAGSEKAFADMMNLQAEKLGLRDSHFKNSTGLPANGHLMSARDVALLSRALIRDFPGHYAMYSERSYTYNNITQRNRNRLLWRNLGVDGLKTGHTQSAGYCLSASAQQEGMRLISVVLGDTSDKKRFDNTAELLRYGFRFYRSERLFEAGQTVAQARVWGGESKYARLGVLQDLYVTFPKHARGKIETRVEITGGADAPLGRHTNLGTVRVFLTGRLLREQPLASLHDVAQGNIFIRISDSFLRLFE